MSEWKNDDLKVAEYEYDFAVDGGATGTFDLSAKANKADLPVGCIVVGHQVLVQTALAGSGASAKIGSTNDDDKYLVDGDIPGSGLATSSASAEYISAANESDVVMTVAGAALSAGKLKVLVNYVYPNS